MLTKEQISNQIQKIEKELQALPKGTLIYKRINGNLQPYLQQTINGKGITTYIKKINREQVLKDIEYRNQLIAKLNDLKNDLKNHNYSEQQILTYNTQVITGDELKRIIEQVRPYKTRYSYELLNDYLYNNIYNKVFILYGLRRSGKTTLMRQAMLNMSEDDFNKTAFIQINNSDTLAKLNDDLKKLSKNNYKFLFIDEVTLLDDFIEGSAFIPDIYVSEGIKIVLSGTDSLGFWLSEDNQLFDRTIMLHTTFIPYAEFEDVLGIKGIDNYICYGGTMSMTGNHYNNTNNNNTNNNNKNIIDEYIDSAIAHNIQHSLKNYQYGTHFRHLYELYEKNELTSVINRVVEDTNHRFTIEVLTKDFISHDFGTSSNNFRNDSIDILDKIDIKEFTNNLKQALDILNKNEQTIKIDNCHRIEIEEYLNALDLIKYIDVETIINTNKNNQITVITQPGLRYSQGKQLIQQLLKDQLFDTLSALNKKQITERILNEIKGRMMEDIILLETTIKRNDKKVFKLQFDRGEYDMVVLDEDNLTCDIYEIKHSDKIVEKQYMHLIDKEKQAKTEFKYGNIINKYVIYRGENKVLDNGIIYINVEDYLKELYK